HEVLVARKHHHDQQAANQRHVDQRQQLEDQIAFAQRKHHRQDVPDFLEELDRQRQQCESQAEVNGCQQPACGIHGVLDEAFHEAIHGKKEVGEYTQRPGAGKVPAAIVQLWIRKTRLDKEAEEMLRKYTSTFHLRSGPGFPAAQEARLIGVDLAELGTHVK